MSHRQLIFVSCRISSLPAPGFSSSTHCSVKICGRIKLRLSCTSGIRLSYCNCSALWSWVSYHFPIFIHLLRPRDASSIWQNIGAALHLVSGSPSVCTKNPFRSIRPRITSACAVPRISSHISSSTHGRYCARCRISLSSRCRVSKIISFI